MNLDRIIAIISTLGLLYFAYGTWRIDAKLGEVVEHLAKIRENTDRK